MKQKAASSAMGTAGAAQLGSVQTANISVTLQKGSLGLTFRSREGKNAIVDDVDGQALADGRIQPGMTLVSVNGSECLGADFGTTQRLIMQAERPIRLVFLPGQGGGGAEGGYVSMSKSGAASAVIDLSLAGSVPISEKVMSMDRVRDTLTIL
jgi:hypothetical protein